MAENTLQSLHNLINQLPSQIQNDAFSSAIEKNQEFQNKYQTRNKNGELEVPGAVDMYSTVSNINYDLTQ